MLLKRDMDAFPVEVKGRSVACLVTTLFFRGLSWPARVAASEIDIGEAGLFVPETILGVLNRPEAPEVGRRVAKGNGVLRPRSSI